MLRLELQGGPVAAGIERRVLQVCCSKSEFSWKPSDSVNVPLLATIGLQVVERIESLCGTAPTIWPDRVTNAFGRTSGVGMNFRGGIARSLLTLMIVSVPSLMAHAQTPSPQPVNGRDTAVQDDQSFSGPSFRKGLWRFVRTLDVARTANKNFKYRVVNAETTRCVDPTHAMKATFSSGPVGSCVSDKPEKVGNRYTFGHRCDYMGAVSTVITVRSDESYTELNEVSTGEHPRTDMVVATRIGDCDDGGAAKIEAKSDKSAAAALQH